MSGSSPHRLFEAIPGQERARDMLGHAIEKGRLASAYLFKGPPDVGKFAAAIDLVRWIKCADPKNCDGDCHSCRLISRLNHPDIELVMPLPTEIYKNPNKTAKIIEGVAADPFGRPQFNKSAKIGIDAIKDLNERLSLFPTFDGGRWAIVRDADTMTVEASNAFLKTLEEPPENAYIILTSSRPEYLLPTIISRTQPVQFRRLSRDEIERFALSRGIDQSEARKIAVRADGSIAPIVAGEDKTAIEAKRLGERVWVALFSRSDAIALEIVDAIGRDLAFTKATLGSAISFLRDHMLAQIGKKELIVNVDRIDRITNAANKFRDPKPVAMALSFLNTKYDSLKSTPQSDLFWMDLIIRGRRIVRRKIYTRGIES